MKEKYFQLAKRISQKSPSRYKVGCCIVKKNTVISIGYNNMSKTHRQSPTFNNYLHAETKALIGLSYEETSGATVYVYREKLDGSLGKSRPCESCFEALRLAKVKEICYTNEEGFKNEFL